MRDGHSALFVAEHLPTIEMLLNHDEDLLEISCTANRTPLLDAVYYLGRIDTVRFLLGQDANVDATDKDGKTALMLVFLNSLVIARMLINAGANVEHRDGSQQTTLHCAAKCGMLEFVRELILEYKANILAVDNPLIWPMIIPTR